MEKKEYKKKDFEQNKLVMIDGMNLLHKAYYATLKKGAVVGNDGMEYGGIVLVNEMLFSIIKKERPTHILFAMDIGRNTFRHQMFPKYKARRKPTPEEIVHQRGYLIDLLNNCGIPSFGIEEYEADDIMATYTKFARKRNWKVKIITEDRDLLQLIAPGVIVSSINKYKDMFYYNNFMFNEEYGFSANRFLEKKVLAGDGSDGIRGVIDVDKELARKIVRDHKDFDHIIDNMKKENIKRQDGTVVMAQEERLRFNYELMRLHNDVELPLHINELKYNGIKKDVILDFYDSKGIEKGRKKVENLKI